MKSAKVLLCFLVPCLIPPGPAHAEFKTQLPAVGGLAVAPDHRTLVISVSSAAKLFYFDTVADKELKQVEVEFQPGALAIQGKKLFAATRGAATIHVLDLDTGKELQEVKLDKDAVESIACHPSKGMIYATDVNLDLFAIDPANGKVTRTKGAGQKVVVDPVDEKIIYTSIFNPARNTAIVQELPGRTLRIQMVKGVARCVLLRFTASGTDLKCTAVNENAAIGAPAFGVSRDGKLLAMSGPSRVPGKGITQHIHVYETTDLTTLKGQLEGDSFPRSIAFHPLIDLVAVYRPGARGEYAIHSSKSLAKTQSLKMTENPDFPYFLLFAGRGEKLVSCFGGPRGNAVLEFRAVPLNEAQRELLKKNLGE